MSILAGAGNLTLNTGITATNSANTTALIQTVGANILLGGNLSLSSTNGGTVGSMNVLLSGILSGAYGIDKNGNSNLTLNGTNSYTGQTKINNGNVNVYSLGNFSQNSNFGQGTAGVSIVIGSGATTGSISMTYLGSGSTSNRTFQIGRGNGTSSATISSSGTGALVFTAANFNTADTTSVSGFSNRTLTLTGTNTNKECHGRQEGYGRRAKGQVL
jgi:autotransporter-associated beta strand protein